MSIIKDVVTEIIQIEKETNTWDESPVFFIVVPPSDPGGKPRVMAIPIPGPVPLPDMLWRIGEGFLDPEKGKYAPPFAEGFIGVAVRWEAYGVKFSKKEDFDEFMAENKRPGDVPNGIEVVGVIGMDADGVYSAAWERDAEEADLFGDGVNENPLADGRLLDGVRHLFEGLQAHSIRSSRT